MTPVYLVDNSVIQRLSMPGIQDAWFQLSAQGTIATCLPLLLEAGYSARSAQEHRELLNLEQRAKITLSPGPEIVPIALAIQNRLFAAGTGRAAGVSAIQIAATAIFHATATAPVTVVHYDSDFDHIADVMPDFESFWIVPRGSVA